MTTEIYEKHPVSGILTGWFVTPLKDGRQSLKLVIYHADTQYSYFAYFIHIIYTHSTFIPLEAI